MTQSIVLMTALVPTVGHKYLIDFADSLLTGRDDMVHVIVGTLEREPVDGVLRYEAIRDTYKHNERVTVHHLSSDVPQSPDQHDDFWNVWKDIVGQFVAVHPEDFFVASEMYGIDMANVLGCIFMPCNRYRETIDISGTAVRQNIWGQFQYILPEFQRHLNLTVTLFGAESCGKTTMARLLASEADGYFIPEWAREYLETVGTEVTEERMRAIVAGQWAIQDVGRRHLTDKMFKFQDTDLLSTVGYYRIFGSGTDQDLDLVESLAKRSKSDLYIVMNDGIPFEADPIRYGGNVRESKTQFWVDILEEFECNYHIVKNTDITKQRREVFGAITDLYELKTRHIHDYIRT